MGHMLSAYQDIDAEPVFQPELYEKFEDTSRPVREMGVTTKEMDRANVPRERRDYCAHLYLDMVQCRREWFPEVWKCSDILHNYHHCNLNDAKHNIMEYERTKRLMARERNRIRQEAAESLRE